MDEGKELHFTNELIDVNALPAYETTVLTHLDQKYKKVMLINFVLSTIFLLLIVSVPAFVLFRGEWQMILFYAPVIIIQLISLFLLKKIFDNRQYAVREKDVIYKKGLIHQQVTIVPYSKIQHVAIHESFLARRYGLAKIVLYTTGDSLSIPGLPLGTAQKVKALILEKISDNDYEEPAPEMTAPDHQPEDIKEGEENEEV